MLHPCSLSSTISNSTWFGGLLRFTHMLKAIRCASKFIQTEIDLVKIPTCLCMSIFWKESLMINFYGHSMVISPSGCFATTWRLGTMKKWWASNERVPAKVCCRVIKGDKLVQGFGIDQFIPQVSLTASSGYIQDNSLQFCILCNVTNQGPRFSWGAKLGSPRRVND